MKHIILKISAISILVALMIGLAGYGQEQFAPAEVSNTVQATASATTSVTASVTASATPTSTATSSAIASQSAISTQKAQEIENITAVNSEKKDPEQKSTNRKATSAADRNSNAGTESDDEDHPEPATVPESTDSVPVATPARAPKPTPTPEPTSASPQSGYAYCSCGAKLAAGEIEEHMINHALNGESCSYRTY
ncbi:MAG: hypothetical protein RSB97_05150 [Christensenella sp.]